MQHGILWPLAVYSLVHKAKQTRIKPSLMIQQQSLTYRRTRFLEHPCRCLDSHNISERTHVAKRPCYCCCRQTEYLLQLYSAVPPDVSNSAWEGFFSAQPTLPNICHPQSSGTYPSESYCFFFFLRIANVFRFSTFMQLK